MLVLSVDLCCVWFFRGAARSDLLRNWYGLLEGLLFVRLHCRV